MYFRIRTIDGKLIVINLTSKLSKIKDLKLKIEEELLIKADKFKCIYLGKILQDEYTLHDYKIKLNDVIQLIPVINNSESGPTTSKDNITEKKEISKDKIEKKETEILEGNSLYYKIGDVVDYYYQCDGAWHETIIEKIVMKKEEILYIVEYSDVPVTEIFIRPRARRLIPFDELFIGQKVMINYNLEEPTELGLWYDFTISKLNMKRLRRELYGLLHISSENQLEIQVVNPKEVYAIETPKLLTERTSEDEKFMTDTSKYRSIPPNCTSCKDKPKRNCTECGCNICGGKHDENKLLLCDECDYAYHMTCLKPPLETIPEGDWYCPECKNDENEIVKAEDKLKESKRPSSIKGNKESTRDWGRGMACVGRTKICDIVSSNHRGKIPGVEVGMSWFFRIQVSESGVHRPHVAGIHGRESDCAYSIVLSGGYEDDVDNGNEFIYTGSGGRDLSGNKRTAAQSSNQTLTRMNKALALNCKAALNDKKGATAGDNWQKGIPVRVVRNYKAAKVSKYAPKEGNRYDGLYKVVKYYPSTGESGFRVWKYLLRRDDPAPAPWTEEGQERMAKLGLKMIYPDGYMEAMKANDKKQYTSGKKNAAASKENISPPRKKLKLKQEVHVLDDELNSLIKSDKQNTKLWVECSETLPDGKLAFLNCIAERFKCAFCLEMVNDPVTTPCAHNFCSKCLQHSFSTWQKVCPKCRYKIDEKFEMKINEPLASALSLLFKGDN